MGSKKPGSTCATNDERPDRGTGARCRHQSPASRHAQKAPVAVKPIAFDALWNAYPSNKPYVDKTTGEPPSGYANQCAMKVSLAMMVAGIDMSSFAGATVSADNRRLAVRAQELADWIAQRKLSGLSASPENITGADWQATIKKRRGIVFFANYWAREGESGTPSGDHIDLWNGWRLTASGLEGVAVTTLRFVFGVESGPQFSDLGKASRILFWEIK